MKLLLKILVPILLLVCAVLGAKMMIASKPKLQSKTPPAVIPKVSVNIVSPATHSPPVTSFGTVQSYFETTLTPQVAGAITHVTPSFRVGKLVKKGDLLASIDSTDYQATLARETAALANNQRQLEEENIRAAQAKSDWLASGRSLSSASEFVLRKPQLAAAKANVSSSKATLNKAQTDILRCSIIAPFDAVVAQRNASIGNYATPQSPLGRLISIEKSEIRLPLTAEQSARILLPSSTNAETTIQLTSPTVSNHSWPATLKRTEPVIDPQNQVRYVIAEIESPYSGEKPLPVGTFVNASIPSLPLEKTLKIQQQSLVNDSFIWAVSAENKLIKLSAKRLHSHQGNAYIKLVEPSLEAPFTIVTRPLSNFRSGMKVSSEAPAQ